MTEAIPPVRKQYPAAEVKVIDQAERKLSAVISTETVDRDGDVIEVGGWELDSYLSNPVVLFAHDPSQPPVGKAINVRADDGRLVADVQFAPTEAGRQMFDLYEGGYMRAFSVGFLPKEWEPLEKDGEKTGGRRFKQQELLEFSAVPVPANPEALTLAATKGIIKQEAADFLVEKYGTEEEKTEEPSLEDLIEEVLGDQKRAFGPHRSSKAPPDTAWDANAEVSAAEVTDLRQMCCGFRGEGESKSDFYLPHHRASDKAVVWRAVANAAARLSQLQGLSESELSTVRAHLAAHYRQFDQTPPWEQEAYAMPVAHLLAAVEGGEREQIDLWAQEITASLAELESRANTAEKAATDYHAIATAGVDTDSTIKASEDAPEGSDLESLAEAAAVAVDRVLRRHLGR